QGFLAARRLPRRPKFKFFALSMVIITLAVFFGLSVSVVRAAFMLIVFYGGEVFMRRGSTLNSLCLALFAILLIQPYAIFDAGLLMSFSGTFGVGVVAPAVMKSRKFNRITEAFVVSTCAAVCVLPVSAVFFGGFSILSPLTSVLILPFFTAAVVAMLGFAAFAVWLAPMAELFLLIAGLASRIMVWLISFLGALDFAWFSLDYYFVPFILVFAIVAVLSVKKRLRMKGACIALMTLVLMCRVYDYRAIQSEQTYISIYSDSVAAWVQIRQGGAELLIITADTPRAYEAVRGFASKPDVVVLLSSVRNNTAPFENLAALYIPPDTPPQIFDISGRFILDLRYTHENEVLLDTGGYTLLFTRASNDNTSPANVVIASGVVRNKREFNADYIVYVRRTIPIEQEHEHSAYFAPLYLILPPKGGTA
ncbi:MAG: ComEC/Rec2 family competence protein, partial [Oscillospiraceae bacterium]|nr:ComEC/Rec2 family competence protein [Oscillospiraceae bacterium]